MQRFSRDKLPWCELSIRNVSDELSKKRFEGCRVWGVLSESSNYVVIRWLDRYDEWEEWGSRWYRNSRVRSVYTIVVSRMLQMIRREYKCESKILKGNGCESGRLLVELTEVIFCCFDAFIFCEIFCHNHILGVIWKYVRCRYSSVVFKIYC